MPRSESGKADPHNEGDFPGPGSLGLSLEEAVRAAALPVWRTAVLLVHCVQGPHGLPAGFGLAAWGRARQGKGLGGGWGEWETILALSEKCLLSSKKQSRDFTLRLI